MNCSDWITGWDKLVDSIRQLEPGDTVRIVTVGVTNPNVVLKVIDDKHHPTPLGEASIAENKKGERYIIEPTWEYQNEENPWLRKDGRSAGEIWSMQIK